MPQTSEAQSSSDFETYRPIRSGTVRVTTGRKCRIREISNDEEEHSRCRSSYLAVVDIPAIAPHRPCPLTPAHTEHHPGSHEIGARCATRSVSLGPPDWGPFGDRTVRAMVNDVRVRVPRARTHNGLPLEMTCRNGLPLLPGGQVVAGSNPVSPTTKWVSDLAV